MNRMTDQPWTRPECWECGIALKRKRGSDLWKCIQCDNEYLSCSRCEKNLEWTFEAMENQKGWDCDTCQRWFCCMCHQHTGYSHETDDDWTCGECFSKKLNRIK